MTKNSKPKTRSASAAVKGRIVGAGVKLADLAIEAGIGQSTLSLYIHGQRSNYARQLSIYEAFCRLAEIDPTRRGERVFWGALLNRAA